MREFLLDKPPLSIKIKVIAICLFSFLNFSCNTTEPPPQSNGKLNLTVEDVSCTEAWLKLELTNTTLPAQLNLFIDEKLKNNLTITASDTILYVDSLLPNKTYNFQTNNLGIQSNKVNAQTLDTTSHNFTFETFTFGGDAGSCVLYDVAIINENSIWAVGEINIADTSENGYTTYNALHWDGNVWELKKIYFPTVCGSSNLTSYPASSVFSFDDGQIWISSSGDKIAILKDGKQVDKFCLPSNVSMAINKIWGISSLNLYVVGSNGSIAHYQNGKWQKIESGTTTIINDIWGITNGNNEVTAYCPVSSFFTPGDKKILRIKNNVVDSIPWNIGRLIYSAWTNKENFLYVCGSGAFEYKYGIGKEIPLPPISMNKIRGNGLNDIFIAGDFGFASHFNGLSWVTYDHLYDINAAYYSLGIKKNMVVLVGFSVGYGIITVGKRN